MPAPTQDGVAFAGAHVEIDGVVVAKITSYQATSDISEEETTGSEDTVGVAPNKISKQVFKPVAVGKTAQVEGIYVTGDQGQADVKDAANTGLEVQIRFLRQDGQGYLDTGFFTQLQESGQLPGIFTFTGQFRVNDRSEVAGTPS